MSGSFIYRHHVEPRVRLYSPREESFLIPLKYIDVSRTTRTNSDVKQESLIEDRFHSVYSIRREASRRIYVVRVETDKTAVNIQARSFMARTLDKIGKKC